MTVMQRYAKIKHFFIRKHYIESEKYKDEKAESKSWEHARELILSLKRFIINWWQKTNKFILRSGYKELFWSLKLKIKKYLTASFDKLFL